MQACSLNTWGTQPFSAAKFRRTRMTLATSTSCGQRSVQVKHAAQSHRVSLFRTRSLRPSCAMRIICRRPISVAESCDWAVRCACSALEAFEKFFASVHFGEFVLEFRVDFGGFYGLFCGCRFSHYASPLGNITNAPCAHGYSQFLYQLHKASAAFQVILPYCICLG